MNIRHGLLIVIGIAGIAAWLCGASFVEASVVHVTSNTGAADGCTDTCNGRDEKCEAGTGNKHDNLAKDCSANGTFNAVTKDCGCTCKDYRCNKMVSVDIDVDGTIMGGVIFVPEEEVP